MKKVYSKILLLGEYTILADSEALTIPFRRFHANLSLGREGYDSRSNIELRKLLQYLSHNTARFSDFLDLEKFETDVTSGLFFRSGIPAKYGLGSSGAVVASIFHQYGKRSIGKINLEEFKELLSITESYFHGKSSGVDPLSIFLNKPVLFKPGKTEILSTGELATALQQFYLYDTGVPSATADFVNHYLTNLKSKLFQVLNSAYINEVNRTIAMLVAGNITELGKSLFTISEFQFNHFKPMIPESIRGIWKQGLKTSDFTFKLCGSGGGGFMLVHSKNPYNKLEKMLGTNLIPLVEGGD